MPGQEILLVIQQKFRACRFNPNPYWCDHIWVTLYLSKIFQKVIK
jgi:hypothetical protein